ncbi:MAG TPA: ABC transporter ATP-binding protein [Acidobacteriaceae bacterium]|nr:ABC transporter ATP-binding protein [Acidobacteriaceae bacterium]
MRWQLLAAVMLMTFTSLTEGVGVALLFPILQVAGFNLANQGHVGHYTGEVRDLLVRSGLPPTLWLATLLMIFMLLMALRSLFSRIQSVLTFRTVLTYELALSRRLYQAIVQADWLFLVRRRSSDFTHALTAELTRVANCTSLLISTLANASLALVYVAIALKLSAGMTSLVLAAGAVLLLLSRRWMRAVHESGAAVSESVSEVYSAASEHLQNLKAMKFYDAQTSDLEMFSSLQSSALQQSLDNTRGQAAAAFWFEAGSLLLLAGIIFASLQILNVAPASMLLLLAVFTRLFPRLAAGQSQLQAFLSELPAYENLMTIYDECVANAEVRGAVGPSPALAYEVRLEQVGFRYDAERPMVLENLSLTIPAGKVTAIVGASGAGKSTVADLVNGLLSPATGRVLVDNVELTPQTARAWRRHVGYVAQETVLFHDTVRANMLWANPDASEQEMRQSLSLAAAEFVFDLPHGLDTTVGDRGILLSHGQRQRIALARALLRKPGLLILDEATSSLDLENEKRILDAIERLKGRATVLLIAHRISAIQRAEMIYLIENGRVAESGDWEGLVSHPSQRIGSLFRLQSALA